MGIEVDAVLDAFMEGCAVEAKRECLATDYTLHYLGLDVRRCHACITFVGLLAEIAGLT